METAIEIKNLSVSYDKNDAVNNISLKIRKGEYVNIIGPNGGGKTTLIKSVLGLLKPQSGNITISGKSIKKGRKFIGYVPQKSETEKNFPITVTETVETALLNKSLNPFKKISQTERRRIAEVLEILNISELSSRQIGELSGGEFQRLLIARALARKPEILILDEPCSNIDHHSSEKIHAILERLNLEGCTIVIVSHDIDHIISGGKRTILINREILFDGIATEEIYKL